METMENLRKRINVRSVNNADDFTIDFTILAKQHTLLIKFLVKIRLLFMKLNQF